jgi:hypothetical protein
MAGVLAMNLSHNIETCHVFRNCLLEEKANPTTNEFSFGMAFDSLQQLEPGQLTSKIDDALAHLYGCESCKAWHRSLFPDYHAHLARVAKYCCVNMFAAVNSPDEKTKFTYGWMRDEPCWLINDDWAFARFCPWCGSALPETDFEPTRELENRYRERRQK